VTVTISDVILSGFDCIGLVEFSATPGSKTPQGIATKFGLHNYVGYPNLTSKYGSNQAAWGVLAHA